MGSSSIQIGLSLSLIFSALGSALPDPARRPTSLLLSQDIKMSDHLKILRVTFDSSLTLDSHNDSDRQGMQLSSPALAAVLGLFAS